jgi:hypothetical protein
MLSKYVFYYCAYLIELMSMFWRHKLTAVKFITLQILQSKSISLCTGCNFHTHTHTRTQKLLQNQFSVWSLYSLHISGSIHMEHKLHYILSCICFWLTELSNNKLLNRYKEHNNGPVITKNGNKISITYY